MAQVVVSIAGRTYRMSCEDGQEKHIEALAYEIDAKMAGLRGSFGEIGEQRLVVMAALTIADELSETKKQISTLETERDRLRAEAGDARQGREAHDTFLAQSLDAAAERIEKIARMIAGKA